MVKPIGQNKRVAIFTLDRTSMREIQYIIYNLNVDYFVLFSEEVPEKTYTHIIVVGKSCDDEGKCLNCDTLPQWILDSNKPILTLGHATDIMAKIMKFDSEPCTNNGLKSVDMFFGGECQIKYKTLCRKLRVTRVKKDVKVFAKAKDDIVGFTYKKWTGLQYELNTKSKTDLFVIKRFLTYQ